MVKPIQSTIEQEELRQRKTARTLGENIERKSTVHISDTYLDQLLLEDLPYGDLTTQTLGIGQIAGVMNFHTRYACTLAGVEFAVAVLRKLSLEVEIFQHSGAQLAPGTPVLRATGAACALHYGWKIAQNLLEYASGIATRTRSLADKAREINPMIRIASTRKNFPGTKQLSIAAVTAGGGIAHRFGLSESFLMFDNHSAFFPSQEELLLAVTAAFQSQRGKKICAEVNNLEQALCFAEAGASVLQFEKILPDRLGEWIPRIKDHFPAISISIAGGVNIDNIEGYCHCGIDLAVTSWMYFGKPMDIRVIIEPD